MDEQIYYIAWRSGILAMFDEHAQAWRPFIVSRYGEFLSRAANPRTWVWQ